MIGTRQSLSARNDEKVAFSERLSYLVNRLRLTDAELSRRSGLPKNTISRYRKAESLPEANHLFTVARALNVDPEWLMTGKGQPQRSVDDEDDGPDEQKLMTLFTAMDEEARQLLLQLALLLWSRPPASQSSLQDRSAGFTRSPPSDD
jgi:transcriptional regulator with XRE-family HTH domain